MFILKSLAPHEFYFSVLTYLVSNPSFYTLISYIYDLFILEVQGTNTPLLFAPAESWGALGPAGVPLGPNCRPSAPIIRI